MVPFSQPILPELKVTEEEVLEHGHFVENI